MCWARFIPICLSWALILTLAGPAQAIPSPDQLLTTVGLLPWLWGLWLGAVAAVLGWLTRRAPAEGRVRAVGTVSLGMIVLLAVGGVGIVLAGGDGLSPALSQEYRCDIGYHEARARARPRHEEFSKLVRQSSGAVAPGTLVLDLRTPWAFHSGYVEGSEHTYSAELLPRLERARAEGVSRLLLVSYRSNVLMFLPPQEQREVLEILWTFDGVEQLVVHRDAVLPDGALRADTVERERAASPTQVLGWPAIEDRFLYDEGAVEFPNATKVLTLDDGLAALRDPKVAIVLAYHRFYRPGDVYREMWSEYLDGVEPSRLIELDYGAPNARAHIRRSVEELGSRPFVALGYGKFDTVHYGASFAFEASRAGNANYLGASARLPELAAYRAAREKGLIGRVSRWLSGGVESLSAMTGVSPLVSLVLLGFVLGLALVPLTWPGTSARHRRMRLEAELELRRELPRVLLKAQYLEPVAKLVGAARSWIAIEAAILWLVLLVAVPAFRVAGLGTANLGGVLWLASCAAGLAALGTPPTRSVRRRIVNVGVVAVLFAAAAPWLGAANVGLLAGLLPLRLAQELVAVFTARRVLDAVGLANTTRGNPTVQASASHGSKAHNLARLSEMASPVFQVAPGVAVPCPFEDFEAGFHRYESLLPPSPWVVRSSAAAEDAETSSMAGHYLSIVNVSAMAELETASQSVAQSVGGKGSVLIQSYIPSELRGVLFSRAPKNRQHMLVEWRGGSTEESVEQGAEPDGVTTVGRTTGSTSVRGKLLPPELLSRLVWLGATLESMWGEPLDMEWGWADGTLHLFQVRPITAFVQHPAISRAQEVALRRLGDRATSVRWERGEFAALLPNPTPLTASVVEEMYSLTAITHGLQILSSPHLPARTVECVMGRLYERAAAEPSPLSAWFRGRRRPSPRSLAKRITDGFVAQIERGPKEPDLGAPVRERSQFVVDSVNWLTKDVFAWIHAATWLHASNPDVESPLSVDDQSVSFALQRDLQQVRTGDLDEPTFLGRWGHRSDLDYELFCPSFSENPGDLAAPGQPQWPTTGGGENRVGSWVRTIDWMKDEFLRRLRRLRPHLVALGRELGLHDATFGLTVEDLRGVVHGEAIDVVAGRARQRWGDKVVLAELVLPPELTAMTLESLGSDSETDARHARFVSRPLAFSGRLRLMDEAGGKWKKGDVLWSESLGPGVVPALPHVAGCLARYGGELSHAAIVARELGRPTAVLDADLRSREGQTVYVERSGRVWFEGDGE